MHDVIFCKSVDILKGHVEVTNIVYRYKPHIATCVSTATLAAGAPALLKRQVQIRCKNFRYTLFVRLRYRRTFIIRNMSPSGDCFVCDRFMSWTLVDTCDVSATSLHTQINIIAIVIRGFCPRDSIGTT